MTVSLPEASPRLLAGFRDDGGTPWTREEPVKCNQSSGANPKPVALKCTFEALGNQTMIPLFTYQVALRLLPTHHTDA